jgi:Abortive infection alpha
MELWARLLANAMDPAMNSVRHSFIEAVTKMDNPDALVLLHIHKFHITSIRIGETALQNKIIGHANIALMVGRTSDDIYVSLRHLEELHFLNFNQTDPGWYVNPTFREFMRACYPEMSPN